MLHRTEIASNDLIPTRQSLLTRLKDWNDQEGWRDFFDTYWKLIYSFAIKKGLNDSEAQDVVQETVFSVLKNLPSFDSRKAPFKIWLLHLTDWRITDQLRRRVHNNQPLRRGDDTGTAERIPDPRGQSIEQVWNEEYESNLMAAAIERVKRKVDAKQYQVFDLYVFKNWPVTRLNSNAAFTITAPLSQTATYSTLGWGLVYGAGYNFSEHHSLVGEVMWNSLIPSDGALAPIRAQLQDNAIHGRVNLVALTGNYRLKFEGRVYGAYFIGGAGLYYRDASLSQTVAVGDSVTCTPAWLWWGFSCASGKVTENQSLIGSSSTVFGGNVGVGLTVRVPDSRYRFYIESRYHYAPTKGVHTQVMPISIGVRF